MWLLIGIWALVFLALLIIFYLSSILKILQKKDDMNLLHEHLTNISQDLLEFRARGLKVKTDTNDDKIKNYLTKFDYENASEKIQENIYWHRKEQREQTEETNKLLNKVIEKLDDVKANTKKEY